MDQTLGTCMQKTILICVFRLTPLLIAINFGVYLLTYLAMFQVTCKWQYSSIVSDVSGLHVFLKQIQIDSLRRTISVCSIGCLCRTVIVFYYPRDVVLSPHTLRPRACPSITGRYCIETVERTKLIFRKKAALGLPACAGREFWYLCK